MPPGKMQILNLYKTLLNEARKYPAYNFRTYTLRRIRHGFKQDKSLTDAGEINLKYHEGLKNLEVLKRQALINSLYKVENIVVEGYHGKTTN